MLSPELKKLMHDLENGNDNIRINAEAMLKEFRYLRTVIVTAAVYRGLNSMLRCLTSPLNLPAPGRRQPIYVIFRFSIDLCFW